MENEVGQVTPVKISLDGIPESTKEEVLNPSAKLLGQAFSGALHFILDPFVKYNIVKNQEMELFKQEIENKTELIPFEDRDDSKIGLALKAMEDSKYQLNSEELREMFSNLIASSVDKKTNDLIEPSFSSILKDLSIEDAILLKKFSIERNIPSVSLQIEDTKTGIFFIKQKHILLFNSEIYSDEVSINSLERLGLIEIVETSLSSQENKERYSKFVESPFYQSIQQELPIITAENFNANHISIIKEHAKLTPLGIRFCTIVLP